MGCAAPPGCPNVVFGVSPAHTRHAPRFKWNDIILAAVLSVGNLKRVRLVPPGL